MATCVLREHLLGLLVDELEEEDGGDGSQKREDGVEPHIFPGGSETLEPRGEENSEGNSGVHDGSVLCAPLISVSSNNRACCDEGRCQHEAMNRLNLADDRFLFCLRQIEEHVAESAEQFSHHRLEDIVIRRWLRGGNSTEDPQTEQAGASRTGDLGEDEGDGELSG